MAGDTTIDYYDDIDTIINVLKQIPFSQSTIGDLNPIFKFEPNHHVFCAYALRIRQ